jgi:hypothetical protein
MYTKHVSPTDINLDWSETEGGWWASCDAYPGWEEFIAAPHPDDAEQMAYDALLAYLEEEDRRLEATLQTCPL